MKALFLALYSIVALSNLSIAQNKNNGFAYAGAAGYQPTKGGGKAMFGGSIGFGVYAGLASLGIGVDMLSQKDNGFYGNMYADLRMRLKKAPTTPFILFQPGFVLRNRDIAKTPPYSIIEKGNLFLAGGVGLTSKVGKVGVTFHIKYAMISVKTVTVKSGTKQSEIYSRPGNIGVSVGIVF